MPGILGSDDAFTVIESFPPGNDPTPLAVVSCEAVESVEDAVPSESTTRVDPSSNVCMLDPSSNV